MNFSDIRNHLYDSAEKYWWFGLLLGLSVPLISLFSSFSADQNSIAILGVLLFFLPIVGRWCQELSKDEALKGLKCRLAILYSDAFGNGIPSDISREIRSWVKKNKLNKAPFKRPYYDSKLPVGPNRLADIVSESAFWTYNLALDIRGIMFVYAGIYLILVISLMYFFIQSNLKPDFIISVMKSLIIFASVIFTSEIILLIKQYNELYIDAKQTFTITTRMKDVKKLSTLEIMQIVERYNILLVSSPPIPSILYRFRQDFLNQAYKRIIKKQ